MKNEVNMCFLVSQLDEDLDLDGIHRGILERALVKLKEGKDRDEIIEDTCDALEFL